MPVFRKHTKTADAVPGERHCRGCGGPLADDQLACLQCGAVEDPAGTRERRWMLPTGALIGVVLLLVTSASFAATTALNTGDPTAVKKAPPPAVAQAQPPPPPLPPASGDGTAPPAPANPNPKGPDLGAGPPPAAPPANGGGGSNGGGHGHGHGNGNGNGNGNGGSGSGSKPTKPTPQPEPPPAKITQWAAGQEGYTVVVYTFDTKSDAKAKARDVAGKGLPAGVLNSDDFPSLDPGSWLVYIGQFDDPKKADKAQSQYQHAGYPGEVTFVGNTPSPAYQDPSANGSSTTPQQP
jgi:predicted nucleic acid-binding Zn ribbon protein